VSRAIRRQAATQGRSVWAVKPVSSFNASWVTVGRIIGYRMGVLPQYDKRYQGWHDTSYEKGAQNQRSPPLINRWQAQREKCPCDNADSEPGKRSTPSSSSLGHFSVIGVVISPVLVMNKLVAVTKSDRIMSCHGGPGYLSGANVMIAGKLNPANNGATS